MDRGYGFIKSEEEGDLFFHSSQLEGVESNSLTEGQEVEFEKGQGRDGRRNIALEKMSIYNGTSQNTAPELFYLCSNSEEAQGVSPRVSHCVGQLWWHVDGISFPDLLLLITYSDYAHTI